MREQQGYDNSFCKEAVQISYMPYLMRKKYFLLSLVVFFSASIFAQPTATDKDSANKKPPPPKDRNMFGLYIPRGLKVNSVGIEDGYIFYPVPNSSLIYLLNRKGELVHQWKGNYTVFQAYLQDDGSVIQGAQDPDYPTFGCCGPYGRIQKISWEGKMLWDFEYANEDHIAHHDFTVMPNGHILAIAYETMTYDKAMALGRSPEKTPKAGPWSCAA